MALGIRRMVERLRHATAAAGSPGERAIHELIDADRFTVLFQPVVDLANGRLLAYESITRPDPALFEGPEEMVAAARRVGRMGELGRAIRRVAIDICAEHRSS